MSPDTNPFVELAAKQQPRFLSDFAARYAGSPPSFWLDAESYTCGFKLACKCGNEGEVGPYECA